MNDNAPNKTYDLDILEAIDKLCLKRAIYLPKDELLEAKEEEKIERNKELLL